MDNNTLVPDGTQRVYAYTSYPELQARFMTGQSGSALEEINRLYGWMMATHDPGHTDWEGIGAGGSLYEGPYTSAAHAGPPACCPSSPTTFSESPRPNRASPRGRCNHTQARWGGPKARCPPHTDRSTSTGSRVRSPRYSSQCKCPKAPPHSSPCSQGRTTSTSMDTPVHSRTLPDNRPPQAWGPAPTTSPTNNARLNSASRRGNK